MCGIAGKLHYDQARPVDGPGLERMCHTLVHRGPDDWGMFVDGPLGLAMRRLAIIDLASGHQPIHNESRTVWTVYNGEIYNFPALRRRLEARGHTFYTATDTEVIVHLYEEYGSDFPRHLNGMFAIAVWDSAAQRLVLTRDHIGIKPLYYAALADRLLFGSEIKAILADDIRPSVDLEALSLYLSLLYIPAPNSIYREIRKLEPGHTLVWEGGRMEVRPYWNLAAVEPLQAPYDEEALRIELRARLAAAVGQQLVADVPLGIFLSGGLDSSAIVAFARRSHSGPLKTFSIGFDDPSYDETHLARIVAQRFETEHTELTVRPDATDLAPKLVAHFDEPFADSSAIPTYYLAQLTRRHVTVALGGDGGDELFAGYATYQADKLAALYQHLPDPISRGLVPAVVRQLPVSDRKVSFDLKARRFVAHALLEPGRRHYAWKAFFSDDLKGELLTPDLRAALDGGLDGYGPFRRQVEAASRFDDLSRYQYADTRVSLPDDMLTKVDRMSMAHSLEARVPLLDVGLVEFAFRLPGAVKMPGLKLKHFLRQTIRDILPREILRQPKRGFNAPMSRWLKSDLRPLVEAYLAPDVVARQGFFQPAVVSRLVADHQAGRADYSRNLWALLMFNLWAEQAPLSRR
ncbi:MAG: asparagine synthase (glutamine-hydrolyzing) [Anaerolineae bacterium]